MEDDEFLPFLIVARVLIDQLEELTSLHSDLSIWTPWSSEFSL